MASPAFEALGAPVDAILALREAYRRDMQCQIVHDSLHARGFTDSYLLRAGGETVGYGSVTGEPERARDVIKEFFVLPSHRRHALPLFRELARVARARWIEAQTNDALLTLMLFDCGEDFSSQTVLFADAGPTHYPPGELLLRQRRGTDQIFAHTLEPVGDWVLVREQEVVATGGLMFHYNPPYGDLYMEVAGPYRRRGYGTYLVQELKRICYEQGRVPAARCQAQNIASRGTLERAGLLACGRIVRARVRILP